MLPRAPDHSSNANAAKLQLLKSFEFNSQLLKSGALVTSDDASQDCGLLFVKGAHLAIKALVAPDSLPADFDKVTLQILLCQK